MGFIRPSGAFSLKEFQGAAEGGSRRKVRRTRVKVKELGGTPLAALRSPGPTGLPSGSSLGSLELPQTSLPLSL